MTRAPHHAMPPLVDSGGLLATVGSGYVNGPVWIISAGVGAVLMVIGWASAGNKRRVGLAVGGILLVGGLILAVLHLEWRINTREWFDGAAG